MGGCKWESSFLQCCAPPCWCPGHCWGLGNAGAMRPLNTRSSWLAGTPALLRWDSVNPLRHVPVSQSGQELLSFVGEKETANSRDITWHFS